MKCFLTFGQRVPAGAVGDALIEEVATVPTFVHPAVSVGVGPRQLSGKTDAHVLDHSQVLTQTHINIDSGDQGV